MSELSGHNDSEKLADLATRTYKAQAIWFLNAFWPEHGDKAEKVWEYKHAFDELDHDRKAEGCALDELQAHRFLEKFNETLTVQAMREKLRSTGAIGAQVKLIPLVHVLVFKYNVDWHELVNAPQGNKEEVLKAQALLDEVQAAFQESEERDAEAAAALRESQAREAEAKKDEAAAKRDEAEAKKDEAEAKAREAEARRTEAAAIEREENARQQEAPFKAAQEEVDAALAEVKAQEDARNSKTEELKRKSQEGGVVQQNKAKNELAQHLAEDPLPLRRAKITLEAALKKAEKARAPFEAALREAEAARAVAEEAANEASQARAAAEKSARIAEAARQRAEDARERAEEARRRSEDAKAAAEEALEEARRKVEEAEAYLEEAKKRLPEGQIWWLEKELQEKRKYLPKSKGGVDKK